MNIGEESEPIELPIPVDPASIPVEQPVPTAPIAEPVPAEPVKQHRESFQAWIDAGVIEAQ